MPEPTEDTPTFDVSILEAPEVPKSGHLRLEVWLTGDTLAPEAQFDRLNRLGAAVSEEAIRRNLSVEYIVTEDV